MFTPGAPGHLTEHNRIAAAVVLASRWGLHGDGVTDDADLLNDGMAECEPGSLVLLDPGRTYLVSGLTIPESVALGSLYPRHGYPPGGASVPTLKAASGDQDWVVELAGRTSCLLGVHVDGANLAGGVRALTAADWAAIRCVVTSRTPGPGVRIDDQNVGTILADSMVLSPNSAAAAETGGLYVLGTDAYVSRTEVVGLDAVGPRTENGYRAGIVVEGWNNAFDRVIAEYGDSGWVVAGNLNKFTGCRGDRNWGTGWDVRGHMNSFAACGANDNSWLTEDGWDGWSITGTRNGFAACHSVTLAEGEGRQRYGFSDDVPGNDNSYAACISSGNGTDWHGATFA